MANATRQLSPSDRAKLKARIAALEQRTSAEVVCAVATESGRYDRAESLCGLCGAVLALVGADKLLSIGSWDQGGALSLGGQVAAVVVGFVAGSVLASYWHGLRQLFVGRRETEAEVRRSAHQVFSQHHIGGTKNQGGLLIYVSLFERRLEVRCDAACAAKLTPADLGKIRDVVLNEVRVGQLGAGLLAGLEQVEPMLSAALPPTSDAADALPNDVLVFHPRP